MASNNDYSANKKIFNECFDIVKSSKTVTVPCCRTIREPYTVKVPKTKTVKVNKQVPYIDYEPRIKQVPYQYFDKQTLTVNVPTCRTIPTIRNVCTTIPVKRGPLARLFSTGPSCVQKKCPRTVYVMKTCCEPRQFCHSIPRTGVRRVQENVPVQKFRMQTELKQMTEDVDEVRYRSRQVNKMVTKTVPVYKLVPKTPAPPVEERVIRRRAFSEPVRGSAIPINTVDARQDAGMYNTEWYVPRATEANIGYKIPVQYGNQYNTYGPPMVLATDTKSNYMNWDGTLGYQEVKFDATNTNRNAVSNIIEHSRNYSQNTERYGNGYQAQSSVDYQPIGVRGVEANYGGVGVSTERYGKSYQAQSSVNYQPIRVRGVQANSGGVAVNTERCGKGYQAQSIVEYQPIGVREVEANSGGVGVNTEGYGKGYQAQSSVNYQPIGVRGVQANSGRVVVNTERSGKGNKAQSSADYQPIGIRGVQAKSGGVGVDTERYGKGYQAESRVNYQPIQ